MLEKATISIDNVDNEEIKMSDKLTWTKKSVLNIFLATNIMKKYYCVYCSQNGEKIWWNRFLPMFFINNKELMTI